MCWGCSVQMTGAILDRRLERDSSIATGKVKYKRERGDLGLLEDVYIAQSGTFPVDMLMYLIWSFSSWCEV